MRQILPLLENGTDVKALAHITGNGLLNLLRVKSEVGFEITGMPEPQPIFSLIQQAANVDAAEMYRVFNMGIGFCIVVPEAQADAALQTLCHSGDAQAEVIGHARADRPGTIVLPRQGLVGTEDGGFVAAG